MVALLLANSDVIYYHILIEKIDNYCPIINLCVI